MKKIILMPDSFKGSMNAQEVSKIMEKAIYDVDSSIQTTRLPISDGGEGFLSFYLETHPYSSIQTEKILNEILVPKEVKYILDGDAAIIESAEIVGLPDATGNVMQRSSYGIGELIKKIIDKHSVKNIILSVGGTSTIDMGLGILEALGAKFSDKMGSTMSPKPENVDKISSVDFSSIKKTSKILILSDVTNTLYGNDSGIEEYSPQKGANSKEINTLIENYKKIIPEEEDRKYFGAGGGMTASLVYFLNAEIISGMDFVLKKIDFKRLLKETDYVFTGEGSIDSQSFQGKVIGKIYEECSLNDVPVFAFAGEIKSKVIKDNLFFVPIHQNKADYENYKQTSASNLYQASQQLVRQLMLKEKTNI